MVDGTSPLEPLRTMADFAAHLGCHPRTARRFLLDAMAADPGLRVTRLGRSVLFTPEQFARTLEALTWRSPVADVALYSPRKERSVAVGRRADAGPSAQERIAARMQRPRRSNKGGTTPGHPGVAGEPAWRGRRKGEP